MTVEFQMWSEHETAERTGLSPRYLQNLRQLGTGPGFYKVGRAVRYDSAEVLAWLHTKHRRSTSDPGGGNAE